MQFNRTTKLYLSVFAPRRFCMWMKHRSMSRETCTGYGHLRQHLKHSRRFKGIIVCDGWKSYAKFTKRLQRCWAHLLRESKELAEIIAEADSLHQALNGLFKKLTEALEIDPPPEVRRELWQMGRTTLQQVISTEYVDEKVRKLIGKIRNGFEYWFTFVIHPGVEPTNNRAERSLREQVVFRKILGTLRNIKGTSIHERIMTVLATWVQLGLNCHQMLKASLTS